MADLPPYPGAPRWAKVLGIIAIGLLLLAVIIVFTGVGGPHGPGRHIPPGGDGGGAPASSIIQPSLQQA